MSVAKIGIVVKESIPFGEVFMQVTHCLGLQMRAEDMHG